MMHYRRHVYSPLRMFGNVRIEIRDSLTARLLDQRRESNLVVLPGRNQIATALYSGTITPPSRMALGTGSSAVTSADSALANEIWRDVFAAKTLASASVTYKYFLTSLEANGNTLTEAGLFNAVSGGDLFARVLFTNDIPKTSGITVLFAWTITIGAP